MFQGGTNTDFIPPVAVSALAIIICHTSFTRLEPVRPPRAFVVDAVVLALGIASAEGAFHVPMGLNGERVVQERHELGKVPGFDPMDAGANMVAEREVGGFRTVILLFFSGAGSPVSHFLLRRVQRARWHGKSRRLLDGTVGRQVDGRPNVCPNLVRHITQPTTFKESSIWNLREHGAWVVQECEMRSGTKTMQEVMSYLLTKSYISSVSSALFSVLTTLQM